MNDLSDVWNPCKHRTPDMGEKPGQDHLELDYGRVPS